ncbi:MAG: hypothetical protein ACR2PT_02750 [Endozoicomonas sp.]
MKIIQKLQREYCAPKAIYILNNISEVPLYHEDYSVRHPEASYVVSLRTVFERINKVLDGLDELYERPDVNKKKEDEILESTDHMLDALAEHIEDCGGILRSFYKKSEKKEFKKSLSIFHRNISFYKKHIGTIVNYMKHNQGVLRFIDFSNDGGDIFGYYVEGPWDSNSLGPAKEIHGGENTAFSFNRDIALHVCSVYYVSSCLSERLGDMHDELRKPVHSQSQKEKSGDWEKLLDRVGAMNGFMLPDELIKPKPLVKSAKMFTIDYPSKTKPKALSGIADVHTSFQGDGVTHTFIVPYMNNAANK